MNRTLAVTAVGVLAAGVTFAAYKSGNLGPQYADVVSAKPITIKEDVYADVLSTNPITQVVNGTREVCSDKLVERRRPERFGNKDGTIIGAVVGGLIGNQIGGGDGRKLATVAGAVGGGYAGREIDRRHVGGKRYTETQRVCRTEDTSKVKTVGYDVQYRMEDGQVLTRREDENPGDRLWLGQKDVITGYDVTWRYKEKVGNLRMDEKPGEQLRIKDGVIVVESDDFQTAQR
ncbi:MAG: glycine zipper 2TM domain-containing protein [Arenimonas sp.]